MKSKTQIASFVAMLVSLAIIQLQGCDLVKTIILGEKKQAPQQQVTPQPSPPQGEIPFPPDEDPFKDTALPEGAPPAAPKPGAKGAPDLTPPTAPTVKPAPVQPPPVPQPAVKPERKKDHAAVKTPPKTKRAAAKSKKQAKEPDSFYEVEGDKRAPRADAEAPSEPSAKTAKSKSTSKASTKVAAKPSTGADDELNKILDTETETPAPAAGGEAPTTGGEGLKADVPSIPEGALGAPSTPDDVAKAPPIEPVEEPLPEAKNVPPPPEQPTETKPGEKAPEEVANLQLTPNSITAADTTKNTESSGIVTIEGQSELHYNVFQSKDLYRVMIDFPKTTLGTIRNPVPTKTAGLIKSVEFSPAQDVTRLNILLERPGKYEVIPGGSKLDISVTSNAPAKTKPLMTGDEIDMPGNLLTQIQTTKDAGNLQVIIEAKETFGFKVFRKANPYRLQVDLPNMRQGSVNATTAVKMGPISQITVTELTVEDKPFTRVVIFTENLPSFIESVQDNRLVLTLKE